MPHQPAQSPRQVSGQVKGLGSSRVFPFLADIVVILQIVLVVHVRIIYRPHNSRFQVSSGESYLVLRQDSQGADGVDQKLTDDRFI